MLIFVEGLRTEELYITYWRRKYRDRTLVTIDPFRGGPLQLVQHAVRAKASEESDAKRGRGRPHDQFWCVFDIDEHPNVPHAIELAGQHGIHLAISNPCLELWFILHFEDRTAYIDRFAAQARAETLLRCRKVLTEAALVALGERYPDATKRAKTLDDKHLGDGSPAGSNPSTSVGRLVEMMHTA